jgi:mRNA interferase MazF
MLAVVPCTTTYRRTVFYVRATPPDGGLAQVSYIICDQVRTISAERFIRYLGALGLATPRIVDERIRAFLDV